LLQKAQRSGFIELIRELISDQNKIYIGTSAGSIIAGPDVSPDFVPDDVAAAPGLQGTQGFELVNFCLLPHWGSDNFRETYLKYRMEAAYKEPQVPLLLLTNTQYVWVKDDQMQIVDVSR
jgi:dipeptidase E